jgi:hypothetical protein
MGANSVAAKVARGLAKANNKVGENDSPIVSVVKLTNTGGGNNPFNPPTNTGEDVVLVNAIFKDIDKGSINNDLIKDGDRELVCDGAVEILQGEVIKTSAGEEFIVVSVAISSPYGIPLSYKPIVRRK